MQRCKNAKFLMGSNGVGTYLDGWGMSIATQRANERQNRTPGTKVMAEPVLVDELKLGGAGARGLEVRAPGCWKYALEAIIKWLLLYLFIHDNCLLFML